MEMQLFLIYKGKFSWLDVDTMPIYELIWYYEKLIEWKKEENNPTDDGNNPHGPPADFVDPFKQFE
jgi:hypothetical protein